MGSTRPNFRLTTNRRHQAPPSQGADDRPEHLVRVLQQVAEEPVVGGALARAEPECVRVAVVDEGVAEGAPLQRAVVDGHDPGPALRRAVAPSAGGRPEVADQFAGARVRGR